MKQDCTAEANPTFETARFGFQLLNAPMEAFG
jgi:hypothetical protein